MEPWLLDGADHLPSYSQLQTLIRHQALLALLRGFLPERHWVRDVGWGPGYCSPQQPAGLPAACRSPSSLGWLVLAATTGLLQPAGGLGFPVFLSDKSRPQHRLYPCITGPHILSSQTSSGRVNYLRPEVYPTSCHFDSPFLPDGNFQKVSPLGTCMISAQRISSNQQACPQAPWTARTPVGSSYNSPLCTKGRSPRVCGEKYMDPLLRRPQH